MLSAWWLHLMAGMVHYVIWPGEVEKVLFMTNKLMTFGYTYAKRRLNRTPRIVHTPTHLVQLATRTLSTIALVL